MNPVFQWFAHTGWVHLTQALLHSLWQAALVSAGLWLVLRRMPAQRPQARYWAALLALALVVLGLSITWNVLDYDRMAIRSGAGDRKSARFWVCPGAWRCGSAASSKPRPSWACFGPRSYSPPL